jgi:hypothetical protein
VRIVPGRPSVLRSAWHLLVTLVAPVGAIVLVLVLTTFLLAYRADVRDVLIRLVSRGNIGLTTQAFDEAGRRVGRYLASALAVNTLYGLVIGLGLGWIGVPSPAMWGVLAGLLRFVPYVGAWVAGSTPFLVAFAVFDGWGPALGVLALFVGAGALMAYVVEPLVYGKRTGLSPVAVILAIVFWTWLWGFAGLLLAVPMTLCLAVAGRYVPGLEFLDVLLRNRPALGPADRAYQRLVALDVEGARRVAEELLEDEVEPEVAEDMVLMASLRRAEVDRLRGALDADRLRCVCDGVVEAAEGVEDTVAGRSRKGAAKEAASAAEAAPAPVERGVLCVPAGDETDAAACELLARRLGALGVAVEVVPSAALSGEVAERVARGKPAVVLVSAVPPFASTRVRYLLKRIRSRSGVPVVAAVWDPSADRERLSAAFQDAGAERTVFDLGEAVRELRALTASRPREDAASRAASVAS